MNTVSPHQVNYFTPQRSYYPTQSPIMPAQTSPSTTNTASAIDIAPILSAMIPMMMMGMLAKMMGKISSTGKKKNKKDNAENEAQTAVQESE